MVHEVGYMESTHRPEAKSMKLDIVMWTKNSSKLLPVVLSRIEQVIPESNIHEKRIIDDWSSDDTLDVAKDHGWSVMLNYGRGVNAAIKTAFSTIQTEYFASFEHDVIVSKDWWQKIPRWVLSGKYEVAQGIRYSTNRVFHEIDVFANERQKIVSLDNTFYHTKAITVSKGSPDATRIRWFVDRSVISEHVKPKSTLKVMQHDYRIHVACHSTEVYRSFRIALTSPLVSLIASWKRKCPLITLVYPLDRIMILAANLKGKIASMC